MTKAIQAGYAGRQVIHTEDDDRERRATDSAVGLAVASVNSPGPGRCLVITGLAGSCASTQGCAGRATIYEGETVIWEWAMPDCGVVDMEFVHGIRCGCDMSATFEVANAGIQCDANIKCRME